MWKDGPLGAIIYKIGDLLLFGKRGSWFMTVSYMGLWKILLEKGLQKQDLVDHAGLSSATVAKMGKGEPVSNKVLDKICKYLECSVNDIMNYE